MIESIMDPNFMEYVHEQEPELNYHSELHTEMQAPEGRDIVYETLGQKPDLR